MARKRNRKFPDPDPQHAEKEHHIQMLVTVPVFGKERDALQMAARLRRDIHTLYGPLPIVEIAALNKNLRKPSTIDIPPLLT